MTSPTQRGRAPANNTVRQRLKAIRRFCAWANGSFGATDFASHLAERGSPLYRKATPTYGKVQSPNPARFLTYEQAYGQLLDSFGGDANPRARRDAIVIRLGLIGLRRAEIASLTLDALSSLPDLNWIGKGSKPRRMATGPTLTALLRAWHSEYRRPRPESPVVTAVWDQKVRWNVPVGADYVEQIVTCRARAAGLGHVTPHDLRPTAANILHSAKTADGAHHYDLLDIQRVLGHADPAVTMKCYLDPLDDVVYRRAAFTLD